MVKKKICMLGSFAVGKTSLVQRFVHSKFSEKYLTTIGVKIDQKVMEVEGQEVTLLLWDIHGEDEFQKIPSSYLKGTAGYFLVIDGTRQTTVQVAEKIKHLAEETLGEVPYIILINKSDLKDRWEIQADELGQLGAQAAAIFETSAKNGEGVESAFQTLAREIIA